MKLPVISKFKACYSVLSSWIPRFLSCKF